MPQWGRMHPATQETEQSLQFHPWVGRDPGRKTWQAILVLPGKSQGQRNLTGYDPWPLKELDTTRKCTHSSHLALASSWVEEDDSPEGKSESNTSTCQALCLCLITFKYLLCWYSAFCNAGIITILTGSHRVRRIGRK